MYYNNFKKYKIVFVNRKGDIMSKKSIICITLAACILCSSMAVLFDSLVSTAHAETVSVMYGDVDRDGKINAFDALLTLRNSINLQKFDDLERYIADVDSDGSITTADALCILRYSVGLKTNSLTGTAVQLDSESLLPVTTDSDNSSVTSDNSDDTSSKDTSSEQESDTSSESSDIESKPETTDSETTSSESETPTSDTSSEPETHTHTWVDVTETKTIHHDAEYVTRTYWGTMGWCVSYGQILSEDELNEIYNTPGRYGSWMNYRDGIAPETYGVLWFDFIVAKYGDIHNFPVVNDYEHEWDGVQFFTLDEYREYWDLDADPDPDLEPVFPENDAIIWNRFPKFNPDTDLIIMYACKFPFNIYDYEFGGFDRTERDYCVDHGSNSELWPVWQEQIKTKDAWDETVTTVIGHKCSICGKYDDI